MAPSDPPKEASHLKASTFKSRADELFFRFRQLLAEHYRTSRSVNFYADKLCITPRYLTGIVQSHYGKSPKEAIDIYTVMQIRLDLLQTDATLTELAYKYNFGATDKPCGEMVYGC